jgi:hypothetical protein
MNGDPVSQVVDRHDLSFSLAEAATKTAATSPFVERAAGRKTLQSLENLRPS